MAARLSDHCDKSESLPKVYHVNDPLYIVTTQQWQYIKQLSRKESLSNQSKIMNTRSALLRRVNNWRKVQAVYMPNVQQRLADSSADSPDISPETAARQLLVEATCLYLPSDLLSPERETAPVDKNNPEDVAHAVARDHRRALLLRAITPELDTTEQRLREAQCTDALQGLRTRIYMRTRLLQYKRLNVRHQAPNVRARDALTSVEEKIELLAAKYRRAREALQSLVGTAAQWEQHYGNRFLALRKEDIRALEDDDPATQRKKKKMRRKGKEPVAEGSRLISWIWRGADAGSMSDLDASKLFISVSTC